MAENSHRAQAAGIDVVTYPTGVKDVVAIVGVLPAGDAMAPSGNIAIPTLAGMMLDRGTKALDKFAIADRLDNVGASISFAVGVQSLEIHGKCLKKDLPLVLGLIAAELRTPALQSQEFAKAKQQFIGSLEASLQNTEGRAQEAFGRTVFPEGHPNRPHSIAEYLVAAKSATLEMLVEAQDEAHTRQIIADLQAAGFVVESVRHVHRYGMANSLMWLRDKMPAGRSTLPVIDAAADGLWRSWCEANQRADYLYLFLRSRK